MNRDAAALVVGIDEYNDPGISALPGNVYSAMRAVDWLLKIGVPAHRIRLHLSPRVDPSSPPQVRPSNYQGVAIKSAEIDVIVGSLPAMSQEQGDQLFVFLCGHGLFVPGSNGGPIFLGQDYGSQIPFNQKSIRLDGLIYWIVRWQFKEQFLFYDGCQDPSTSVGQVSWAVPVNPMPDSALPVPIFGALLACLAASPGQYAWAGSDQGVLVRHVLGAIEAALDPGLSPDAQEQDSIQFDWTTGKSQLDLRSLFINIVAPAITEEANRLGRVTQTPECSPEGLAKQKSVSPILDLASTHCTKLTINIDPPAAALAVKQLRLSTRSPVRTFCHSAPVVDASQWMAPTPSDVTATCVVDPGRGWLISNSPQQATLGNQPVHITLNFSTTLLGPPPPSQLPGAPISAFNIRLHFGDGRTAAPLGGAYEAIARTHSVSLAPPPGVTFMHQEIGPDISFDSTVKHAEKAAAAFAAEWHTAIKRSSAAEGLAVSLYPPGIDPQGLTPNVRFRLSKKRASTLAGFLAETTSLVITRSDIDGPVLTRSLAEIGHDSIEWFEPGVYRLAISLPWGSWSHRFVVREGSGVTECALPERIGRPPLRNRFAVAGTVPTPDLPARAAGVAPLLISAVPIIIESEDSGIRVEPYSRTNLPEWDLLFSAGRSDGISEDRIRALVEAPPKELAPGEHDLLMLGLAYSAYRQGWLDALDFALNAITGPLRDVWDIPLLRDWMQHQNDPMAPNEWRPAMITRLESYSSSHGIVMREGASLLAGIYVTQRREVPMWVGRLLNSSVIAV
jgi:hypothetical protein